MAELKLNEHSFCPHDSYESSSDVQVKDFHTKLKEARDNFIRLWSKNVPEIFCSNLHPGSAYIKYDEEAGKNILLAPLEQFICDSKEVAPVFEHLKTLNATRPSLCGKVFKPGEATYSCRDCRLDPTCVLCVDCFKNSAHRFHRYKMSAGDGGYCDCGDEEAWKTYSYCDNHNRSKSQVAEGSSTVDKLPQDLVARLKIVMTIVLDYCHDVLAFGDDINLPVEFHFLGEALNKDVPKTFCTMLYNENSYNELTHTLSEALNCSLKVATDFATIAGREGRSVVASADLNTCQEVCKTIERLSRLPYRQAGKLKARVMHRDLVAHQVFALRLLAWLKKIVCLNEGFCHVFTNSIFAKSSINEILLDGIMMADAKLWKAARNHWHELFISGMLMEQTCKKAFAKYFTSEYPRLMTKFIEGNQDHSNSVMSLSVQIYTVPTLAHLLIQEENAINEIMRAFLSVCNKNRNEDGILAFQRNLNYRSFRRAQYMLYDVSYLMTVTPSEWNNQLHKSFCNGMQSFLTLLCMMQGMDSVKRKEGQHVEYEDEWDMGVNLQFDISSVDSLMLKWCGSDYAVFVETFRNVLKHFQASYTRSTFVSVELANHSALCIKYDVSKMPVTIHLPLVRFIACMFLNFEKFNLSYESPQFLIENVEKPGLEQLMELSLRTLVMLAQFHAGMWNRNGYSLRTQVEFYHSLGLRDEMYDRDILMLQIAASMIESNKFLIYLVHKHGLLNWTDISYGSRAPVPQEENIEQVLTVAEEFLKLVLTIVSERYVPGLGNVGETEKTKKEIVQLLCIEPMPHSQLFKMLPMGESEDSPMEDIVTEVAVFKKPRGPGTGKYELKPEYYKWFNPFYYHYTRENQSQAEEVQMKRKKQLSEELCFLPPVPPEFMPRYCSIINILQSDVMLHIMEVVMKRTLDLHSAAFSETQLEEVLHLIGVALHDEERLTLKENQSVLSFTAKASKRDFLGLFKECLKSSRVELCGGRLRDLLSWVIKKYQGIEALHARSEKSAADLNPSSSAASASENLVEGHKQKSEAATARRARIMAQMSALQKNFIKEHAEMFQEAVIEESSSLTQSEMDTQTEFPSEDPVCFYKDSRWKSASPNVYTCIICREDQELTCSGQALVLAAFIQKSSVLSKNRKHQMIDPYFYDPLQLPADLFYSPHVSSCGHVMHGECWQKFFKVLCQEQREPLRFQGYITFNTVKNEFSCPLCERLCNSVIPIIPPLTSLVPSVPIPSLDLSMNDWLGSMKQLVEGLHLDVMEDESCEEQIKYIATFGETFMALFFPSETESMDESTPSLSTNVIEMMELFHKTVNNVGFGQDITTYDMRKPPMTWWACIYTIHVMERFLRDKKKPLFGALSARNSLCLTAIIRFCGASLSIFDEDLVKKNCICILRYLLLGIRPVSSFQSCLDIDAFSVLTFLILSIPVFSKLAHPHSNQILHPLGTELDKNLVHLVLMFHFVQVILTHEYTEDRMETDEIPENTSSGDKETVTARLFYEEVRSAAGCNQETPPNDTVVQCFKTGALPFLRCAAILFHVLTDTPPPSSLQEVNSCEFESICKYLGLPPNLHRLLGSTSLKQLALSWAGHPHTIARLEQGEKYCLVRHPLSVNKLVPLPNDYSELINSVSQFTCPNSGGNECQNPTMCLVCGQILCSQPCCKVDLNGTLVGACTNHAHFCGSGTGIFLRTRDCKVLLLCERNKGCFTSPPYVDEYGETDQGLVRGNPLHLCPERYQELNELWLCHNIPEHVCQKSDDQEQMLNVWLML